MNYFDSEPYSLTPCYDRDEDGYPCIPEPEPLQCEYCDAECADLLPCLWDATLQVCAACAVCEPEPECECAMSGDQRDPRGCELHDSTSPWNVRVKAVEMANLLQEAGCTPAEVLAWKKMTPQRAVAELKREVA